MEKGVDGGGAGSMIGSLLRDIEGVLGNHLTVTG